MNIEIIILLALIIGAVVLVPLLIGNSKNLNRIKANKTGDGQYGTADWATKQEIESNLVKIKYNPADWRKGKHLPTHEGVIVSAEKGLGNVTAYVDTSDNHTLVVSAPGGGKTTSLLYPNLEYSAAARMSGFITDTKGNVFKDYAPILEKYYDCSTYIIDLRYPLSSAPYNFLYLVNKYMDSYKQTKSLSDIAMAESYAKNIGDNIIHMDGFKNAGQNQFFYTAAEGIIAGVTLLVSELCEKSQRHIVSVFKIIRQLMEIDPSTTNKKGVSPTLYLTELYLLLPDSHTAKDLLAPTAASEFKTIASVMSTAMAQMLKFIDKEMEQILCFDDGFNIDSFVKGKSFIFFVVDEKSNTKNFMINLLIKQIYGELLKKAESYPDISLPHRVVQWLDEFGTYTKIEGAEQMFSAGRSRNIISVPFLQTMAQLNDKYGKNTADTIINSCQNVLFSYQSPMSTDAEVFSKKLSTKTVTAGSVSSQSNYNHNSSSQTLNMVKMPLMSPDQITRMKKGQWVLMKSGMNPAKVNLYKTEDWNITFDKQYTPKPRESRTVKYADRNTLFDELQKKYGSKQNKSSKQTISSEYID